MSERPSSSAAPASEAPALSPAEVRAFRPRRGRAVVAVIAALGALVALTGYWHQREHAHRQLTTSDFESCCSCLAAEECVAETSGRCVDVLTRVPSPSNQVRAMLLPSAREGNYESAKVSCPFRECREACRWTMDAEYYGFRDPLH